LASPPDAQELKLLELIDAQYPRHPFYGSRKIKHYLNGLGRKLNRKHVQRLMRWLGLAGMAPGPNTSRAHPQHKIYQSASGGGAKIVDKHSGLERLRLEIALKKETKPGQRCSAANERLPS